MVKLDLRWGETAETLFQHSVQAENKRLRERYLALALVASGQPLNQVAEEVGRQRQTIGNWVRQFNEDGLAGLEPGFKGSRQPRLSACEFRRLEAVLKGSPEAVGFKTKRWRSWQVAQYIKSTFDKQVHPETARRYLIKLVGEVQKTDAT